MTRWVCLFVAAALAGAQSFQGSLRGRVADPSGAVVSIARISMIEEATSVSSSTLTNNDGEYSFPAVKPSTYTLIVEAPGFKKYEQTGILVGTQMAVAIDVTMQLGEVTETVTVSADAAPLLETTQASTGQVIDRQKLEDLPNIGRNPFILSRLTETVVWTGNPKFNRMQDQSGSSQISIAGGPTGANNYTLDGISITDSTNRATIIPDQEAVEEVKVQANTYDAEMGRTGGGTFNTTLRSGTNTLHGSLFGTVRQTDWLANNFFANRAGQGIPDQPFKSYGDSLGGPIWIPKIYDGRNRSFFFVTTEGYRQYDAATSTLAVPTALERVGDFSESLSTLRNGSLQTMYDPLSTNASGARTALPGNIIPSNRISPIGLRMASYYPLPNGPTTYYGQPNFTSTVRAFNRADQGTFKFDQVFTSWLRGSVSYLHYGSQEPSNRWFPDQTATPGQGVLYRKTDATQANATATLDPTTVLTVRFGYNRFPNFTAPISRGFRLTELGFSPAVDALTPNFPSFPSITNGDFANYGGGNTSQSVYYSTSYNAAVTKFLGKHSLKVGFDYRKLNHDANTSQGPSSFTFGSQFTSQLATRTVQGTGGGLANQLMGFPSGGSISLGTKFFNYVNYWAFFIQDDFRMTNKLTLTLGFRGESESNPQEVDDKYAIDADLNAVSPLQPNVPQFNLRGAFRYAGVDGNSRHRGDPFGLKIGPRIGFAYQATPETVVRGGWGVFWIPQSFSAQQATGYSQQTSIIGSIDNNFSPASRLENPYPNGLLIPVGNAGGASTALGQAISGVDSGNRSAGYVQQMSFDLQQQVRSDTVVSVGYIGSHTLKTPYNIELNELHPQYYSLGASALSQLQPNPFFGLVPNTVSLGSSQSVARSTLLRVFPQYTNVTLSTNMGRSFYYSFYAKIQKRLSAGFTLLATYTWSRNMTLDDPQTYWAPITGQGWTRATNDIPHNYSMAITYELPFGKGKPFLHDNTFLDLLVGGWSINMVNLITSGRPIAVSQTNQNTGCNGCTQRPSATGLDPVSEGSVTDRINGWLNPAAFVQTPAYTYGTLGPRINVYGPGLYNWDVSMFKTFTLMERVKAQFRAEALNATNTPLFAQPGQLNISNSGASGQLGVITSQTNYPRLMQLGVRVTF